MRRKEEARQEEDRKRKMRKESSCYMGQATVEEEVWVGSLWHTDGRFGTRGSSHFPQLYPLGGGALHWLAGEAEALLGALHHHNSMSPSCMSKAPCQWHCKSWSQEICMPVFTMPSASARLHSPTRYPTLLRNMLLKLWWVLIPIGNVHAEMAQGSSQKWQFCDCLRVLHGW